MRKRVTIKFTIIAIILILSSAIILINITNLNGNNSFIKITKTQKQSNHKVNFKEKQAESNSLTNVYYIGNFTYTHEFLRANIKSPSISEIAQTLSEITIFSSRHISKEGNNLTRSILKLSLDYFQLNYSEQWFDVEYNSRTYYTANIIVKIGNITSDETVTVFLAHYDSLSLNFAQKEYPDDSPGVDDDASGVTALLMALRKINMENIKRPTIIAFISAETCNHLGIIKFLDYLEQNNITVKTVFFIDQIGYKIGRISIFDKNGVLKNKESVLRKALDFSFAYFEESRAIDYRGAGEFIFYNYNINAVVISEENYSSSKAFSPEDTIDYVSLEKIRNATILLEALLMMSSFNLPTNNTITSDWIYTLERTLSNINFIDLTELTTALNSHTIIVDPLVTSEETLHNIVTAVGDGKVIFLGASAAVYFRDVLGKNISLEWSFKTSLMKPDIIYHPLLHRIPISNIINETIEHAYTFALGDLDIILNEKRNMSILKFIMGQPNIILFGIIIPNNFSSRVIRNAVEWEVDEISLVFKEDPKFIQGVETELNFSVFETRRWTLVESPVNISIISMFRGDVLFKGIFENRLWNEIVFVPKYPSEYKIKVQCNGKETFKIVNSSQTVFYKLTAPSSIVQGDSLNVTLHFLNNLNETITILPRGILNSTNLFNESIVIKPGESILNITSERIWKSGNLTITLILENSRIFILSECLSIFVDNGIEILSVKHPSFMEQGMSHKIIINLRSKFSKEINITLSAKRPFVTNEAHIVLSKNKTYIIELQVAYVEETIYDFGKRELILEFIGPNGVLLLRKSFIITIIPSFKNLMIGIIAPSALGVFVFMRSFVKLRAGHIPKKFIPYDIFSSRWKYMDVLLIQTSEENIVNELKRLDFQVEGDSIAGKILSKDNTIIAIKPVQKSVLVKIITENKDELNNLIPVLSKLAL